MNRLLIFPGQGGQKFGEMFNFERLTQCVEAKRLFDNLREQNTKLLYTMRNGPQYNLMKTINLQPAIFVASLANYYCYRDECLGKELPENEFYAGFSIGEMTALVAAGIVSVEDGYYLINERAAAMQHASDKIRSAMYIVNGLTELEIEQDLYGMILKELKSKRSFKFEISIYLSDTSFCVSMTENAKDTFRDKLRKYFKHGRAMPLEVSGGFHSSCMDPALTIYSQAVDRVNFNVNTKALFMANLHGDFLNVRNEDEIKHAIVNQINNPIKWGKTLNYMEEFSKLRHLKAVEFSAGGPQVQGVVKKFYPDLHKDYRVFF